MLKKVFISLDDVSQVELCTLQGVVGTEGVPNLLPTGIGVSVEKSLEDVPPGERNKRGRKRGNSAEK